MTERPEGDMATNKGFQQECCDGTVSVSTFAVGAKVVTFKKDVLRP